MDNEEIRKLLQELKETSDESSAVRSRVVKIHMDTPEEAKRRRRAKERERAQEESRKAAERARAEAEEEERRMEAEKAALEAVEEAKAQAKGSFSSDLDEVFLAADAPLPEDEDGESASDLDLNWSYEKPSLTSSFAQEDPDPVVSSGQRKAGEKKPEASGKEPDPDEEDFDSDEGLFRTDGEDGTHSITGLPGRFGAFTDGILGFFGTIGRTVKEDVSKARSERGGKDSDSVKDQSPGDGQEEALGRAVSPDPGAGAVTEEESRGKKEAGRMTEPAAVPEAGSEHITPASSKEMHELPSYWQEESSPDGEEPGTADKNAAREYGPDEEWKRRMEEAPRRKSRLQRMLEGAGRLRERRKAAKDESRETAQLLEKEPETVSGYEPDTAEMPAEASGYEPEMAEVPAEGPKHEAETSDVSAEGPKHEAETSDVSAEKDRKGAETEETPVPRSIELIDLNENQNNKEAEVIPLTGDTGPLPDPGELRRTGAEKTDAAATGVKKHLLRGRVRKASSGKKSSGSGAVGEFLRSHAKQCVIGIAAAAVVIAAVILAVFLTGRMQSARHAVIEADEGLTVRVLKQPDSYTGEGDVQISVKAPETIQSITVNGENVVAPQERSAEFTYHATGGTLDVMAVSTDKVRSAKVVLAYVDSQPPAVTIKEEDGRIALSAEDKESGLDAIYIGSPGEASLLPVYEKYTETLEMDPEKEISYYAVDVAGNKTTPVTVALTPAESIAFERERFGLYPGQAERITLVTTPPNAFVNNLTLEAENPKVVQVEGDMQIRGMAEGDTKITATADGIAGVMASVSVSSRRKVRISAIGDCTLGTDPSFSQNTSFDAYEALYGDSYFFEKVKGILGSDDATFANFEGTLTTSGERRDTRFTFKGDPSYTQILLDGSVEVVTLANNHAHDYLEQGLNDTKKALEDAGIGWCENEHIAYMDLNGVRTAFIGIYALENGLESKPLVQSTIAEAKQHGADLIIVGFHWGVELVTEIDEFERELAHTAIDEGANLVLGTHSHLLMGIEKYNGSYIVYGLGNFCFGGNSNPTSYDSMIWQQTFTFTAEGLESEDDIAIIPCQVSGDTSINNYQPVPVSGDAAAAIMQTIDHLSAGFGQSYSQYMVDGTLWTDTSGTS